MDHKELSDHQLIEQLEQLRETEPRNPHAAAATRVAFLIEARNAAQGVSGQPFQRLNEWMAAITTFLAAPRKEKGVPMYSTVLTLIVVLSLAFGGGTVAAAQTSMPNGALYQIKILSEDARISISADPETQFQLALGFAARRMDEIRTMLQSGEVPPQAVTTRLQNQLNHGLNLAMNMPEGQLQPTLLQVQTQLQQHDQTMNQLQLQQDADQVLLQSRDQIRTMLQQQLQLCQTGMENPDFLRDQLRTREQDQLQQQLQDGMQNQNQNQNQDSVLNQNQQGELNQYQYQNQEGKLNQDQQGKLNQNQNQFQNGSNAGTPSIDPVETPTSGTAPGDGTSTNCPSGDCDGSGPKPGDGTCPNCPSGDCDCDGSGQTDQGGNGNKP
jgi:hypothetical protein